MTEKKVKLFDEFFVIGLDLKQIKTDLKPNQELQIL